MSSAIPVEQQSMADNNNTEGITDSDTDLEDSPEYYQPISAVDGEADSSDEDGSELHDQLPNGYYAPMETEMSSLDLSDDDEKEAEEEEERMRTEIERAVREDQRRRNAPLPAENASRVMEAMRGVQFGGHPPQWAGRVNDDEWIEQIRNRLRTRVQSTAAANSSSSPNSSLF